MLSLQFLSTGSLYYELRDAAMDEKWQRVAAIYRELWLRMA